MKTLPRDVLASLRAMHNIGAYLLALVEKSPVARKAALVEARADRLQKLTSDLIDDADALVNADELLMSGSEASDLEAALVPDLCSWWEHLHDTLVAVKPHLAPPHASNAEQVECLGVAAIAHRMLTLGYAAIGCLCVGLTNQHLPAASTDAMQLKSNDWFDSVWQPLSMPANRPEDPLPVNGVLENIIDALQCDAVHVFSHGLEQHQLDSRAIDEILSNDSADVMCAQNLARSAVNYVDVDDLRAQFKEARDPCKALRALGDALASLNHPAPQWLADALAAFDGIVAAARDRLHPAVVSTLRQQPECMICMNAMDALDIVILPCWRPPPPHDAVELHCICDACHDQCMMVNGLNGRQHTCPKCRSPLQGEAVLRAEDDVAGLLTTN